MSILVAILVGIITTLFLPLSADLILFAVLTTGLITEIVKYNIEH